MNESIEKTTKWTLLKWTIGTIIAFIAAGGGFIAWKSVLNPEYELSYSELKLVIGEVQRIRIYYKGTHQLVIEDIEWSSNKPAVVSVEDGSITAHKADKAEITAKINESELIVKIEVIKKDIMVNSIKITPDYVKLFVGDKQQLHVVQKDIAGKKTNEPVNWWSDNPSKVSVSDDGYITVNNTGEVKIYAKVQNIKRFSIVKSRQRPIDPCDDNSLNEVSLCISNAVLHIYIHTDKQKRCSEKLKTLIKKYKEIKIQKSKTSRSSTIVRHFSQNSNISKTAIKIAQTLEKLGYHAETNYYPQNPFDSLRTKNNLFEIYFADDQ